MKFSFDQSILVAMVVALLMMGLGYLSLEGISNLVATAGWVEHTQVVIDRLQGVLTQVDEESRMMRSFVFTGNPAYQQSFQEARQPIPGELQALKQLTSDNPNRQKDFIRLQELLDQQMAVMEHLGQSGEHAQSPFVVQQIEESNHLIDQIKGQITAMQSDERQLLQKRTAASVESSNSVRAIIMLGSVFGILVILGSTLLINREMAARQRSQRELDRFFTLTNDLFCIAGFDGYFKRLNPAWEKLFGYTTEELKSKPFAEFLHPDDLEKTRSEFARQQAGQGVISFENRYRCKDGTYRWLLWNAHPLVGEQLIFASARDMTERKQMEESLRQSEERTRLMIESVKDYAIFMLDPGGRVVSWNSGAERIKGYRAEEIIGQHFSRFYPQDKIDEGFPARELKGAAEKGHFEDEGWRVRKDGSRFWADVVMNAVRDAQGELLGFVKLTRDISERRKAEEALRMSEERNRSIIEYAHDAFISIDIEGRIKDWNLQAESTFGWLRAEALGRYLHELIIPPKYREAHLRGIKHFNATGEGPVLNKTIELSALRRNGDEFPVELVIWPVQVGNETTFHAFVRDITARKDADERIQTLNEELKQRANLLEVANKELESFSYSVSHDLRAPLRHVHGFIEILQKSPALQEDATSRRHMMVISKAAKEMGRLIDDLLAFSRTGRAEMHPVKIDMREMIDQIIQDREVECEGRRVTWEIKPLSLVAGDPTLLRLVWTNLLDNALKYTQPRPEAKIEIGQTLKDDASNGEHEVVFYVRDNGVGFDMQYASKLFGVFHRLHRAEDFEGTGIGLANVQRIIHRHGGRVWAEAKIDSGATFYFSLPLTAS